jgi:hypothetical protein
VISKLFNSQLTTSQTIGPIVIMSLKIYPTWKDNDNTIPVPITFQDLRQLLYQFGKSIQLILEQSNQKSKYYSNKNISSNNNSNTNTSNGRTTTTSMELPEPPPIDTSEVMAHVSYSDISRFV